MANPEKQHCDTIKWIFRYLKGTIDYGIIFVRQKSDLLVVGYVDADYAGDLDDRSLDDDLFIFLLLYVDDMLIATKSIVEVNKLKVLLSREFDMKDLGAANKILEMEIRGDKDAKRLWLSQARYVKKVLERFNIEKAKPASTPLVNHFCLSIS